VTTRIFARVALFTAIAFGLFFNIAASPAWSASTDPCKGTVTEAKVDSASKVEPAKAPPSDGAPAAQQKPAEQPATVSLGDRIAVTVSGLKENYQKDCAATPLVLYLNNYPLKSLPATIAPAPAGQTTTAPPPAGQATTAPAPAGPATSRVLTYELRVTDDSRTSWVHLLGSPSTTPRAITVSVGLEDLYPLPSSTGALPKFKLNIIGNGWFWAWVVIFFVLFGGFMACALCTNVIRDGNPADAAKGAWGTYSLSKSQGAWWFFIILAAYLLIGLVTGDFFDSINSTALILLGIGAGTVIGSAVIDSTMRTQDAEKTADAITGAEKTSAALTTQLTATPNDDDLKAKKQAVVSQLRKLRGESESYFKDILSDANGVNFHRFQLMAWTIVLGIIFAKGVYENLAMPEFNTTLMGLLGLSAGTYLGLKIPEAPTPRK